MASPLDEVGDIPGDSEAPTSDWQAILHGNNQVVLYNSTNKAVTVTRAHGSEYGELEWEEYEHDDIDVEDVCPYCHRPMAEPPNPPSPVYPRAPNYFHLLAESTSSSRPRTPPGRDSDSDSSSDRLFTPGTLAEGYFDMFFREERKLGMGANGSVFLCQHVLDGNMLGHFAVKKIAVGSSHEYLVNILKEVRLLETLRHQNIITYHHSWLETSRFSAFGPSIPTLFVLMQWAEGGSLDDFIASRQGLSASGDPLPSTPVSGANGAEEMTKAQRIAAFRARNRKESGKKSTLKAIHLLSADEILHLFSDITSGLAFLHDRAILHLDLKPGNVLLTWDAGSLVPRAMLSDFGASRDMLQQNASARTGVTGTLEYTAPEVLQPDFTTGLFREMDTKSDMWSLGVILHKLIFFTTPFHGIDDLAALQEAITRYPGFFLTPDILDTCIRRGLPVGVLHLLTTLLDIQPLERPSSERVFGYVRTESVRTSISLHPLEYS
ncbi:kinase-like protein, partial [Clavulina sp. PMI_390]